MGLQDDEVGCEHRRSNLSRTSELRHTRHKESMKAYLAAISTVTYECVDQSRFLDGLSIPVSTARQWKIGSVVLQTHNFKLHSTAVACRGGRLILPSTAGTL